MAKQSTTQRSSHKAKPVKHGKSKNHILKDHDLDKLIVPGKRKRVPTERALEALSLLRPSKKIKKVAAKPKVKRLNTMQKTAHEGKTYLKGSTPAKRHSANKSVDKDEHKDHDEHTPPKISVTKTPKVKKHVDRSRSRTTSKSHKKATKSRSVSSKKSKPLSKSHKKGKTTVKRTKTMTQTLKDAKKILGFNEDEEDEEEEEEEEEEHHAADAKHSTGKSAKKGGPKRTHTMAETIASGKAYLVKGPRSSSKSKGKK